MRPGSSVCGVLLALCLAGPAHAHATLVSTDPGADNAVVAQAPRMVQLRFKFEAVAPVRSA